MKINILHEKKITSRCKICNKIRRNDLNLCDTCHKKVYPNSKQNNIINCNKKTFDISKQKMHCIVNNKST
jgi:hypothetical protein